MPSLQHKHRIGMYVTISESDHAYQQVSVIKTSDCQLGPGLNRGTTLQFCSVSLGQQQAVSQMAT